MKVYLGVELITYDSLRDIVDDREPIVMRRCVL